MSYVLALAMVVIFYLYFKKNKAHFIYSLFYIYSVISILISLFYIDNNYVFSPELQKHIGGEGESAVYYSLYFIAFITISTYMFRESVRSKIECTFQKKSYVVYNLGKVDFFKAILFVIIIFHACSILYMTTTPIPFLSGIDRVTFFKKYGTFFLENTYRFLNLLALLISTIYIYRRDDKKTKNLAILAAVLILVSLFMAGNKFSTPLRFILISLIPISILYINNKINIISSKVYLYGLLLVFIFVSIIIFYVNYNYPGKSIYEYFVDRVLVSQGQLWWEYYDRVVVNDGWSYNDFNVALENTINKPLYGYEGNVFLLYLMHLIVSPSQLEHRISVGYLYTGGYPAILLVFFGKYASILVHILIVFLYNIIIRLYFTLLASGYFFSSIMCAYIGLYFAFILVSADFGSLMTFILKVLFLFFVLAVEIHFLMRKPRKSQKIKSMRMINLLARKT